jgi:hypothetical protein
LKASGFKLGDIRVSKFAFTNGSTCNRYVADVFAHDAPMEQIRASAANADVFVVIRVDDETLAKQLAEALVGKVAVTPGCQIGYMGHTGCRQLVFWLSLPGVRFVTWTTRLSSIEPCFDVS